MNQNQNGRNGNQENNNGKKYFESKHFSENRKRFSSTGKGTPGPATNNDRPMRKPDPIPAETPEEFVGVFSVGKNGIGYVNHRESGGVVVVEPQHANHALSRDQVKVRILNRQGGLGQVIEIVKRSKVGYAGVIELRGDYFVLIPTDTRDPELRIIGGTPADAGLPAQAGKKAVVALDRFEGDIAYGTITNILGNAGENDPEMLAIALEKGFSQDFPEDVIREAESLQEKAISPEEIARRKDMRDILTFTIDPIDAKDFDDALSFQKLSDGMYEIGVHIADVSHYVRPGSALDEEARKRTTSVYLVDRCIPMLPEALSNDLCSLRADEDKLAFSTIFKINPTSGAVLDVWYGRTIIKSNKRFTYEEAQEILDAGSGLYFEELSEFNRLAKIYTQDRFRDGALSLDQEEVRFVLDEKGHPIRVMVKERIDTNKLIEEFMLLANKHVAIRLSQKDAAGVAVYRVHDKPSAEKMEDLQKFLKTFGFNVSMKNGLIPQKELQEIIKDLGDGDTRDTIQTSIVRSMAKAIYSTANIGHYGLAFAFYTHFTSPIRRYPDTMVHRLLQMTIDGEKVTPEQVGDFEQMARISSERERDAQEAEWASIKYKQVEYMADRIGQTFEGIVTGLGKYGAYVAEVESRSEGMIRLMDLGDDFYTFEENNARIIGTRTREEIRIGTRIKILVKEASLEKRMIDYKRVVEKASS